MTITWIRITPIPILVNGQVDLLLWMCGSEHKGKLTNKPKYTWTWVLFPADQKYRVICILTTPRGQMTLSDESGADDIIREGCQVITQTASSANEIMRSMLDIKI